MTDIKIVENLLPQGYADDIEYDLLGSHFPWFHVNDVTNPNTYGTPGLTNLVFDHRWSHQTEYYRYLKPVTYFIEEIVQRRIQHLLRIRIGYLQKQNSPHNPPHLDFLLPHMTACYYVNDADGDTVLFDKTLADVGTTIADDVVLEYAKTAEFTEVQRCAPVKNKICVFDGHRFHASSHPTHSSRRIVITFNFVV